MRTYDPDAAANQHSRALRMLHGRMRTCAVGSGTTGAATTTAFLPQATSATFAASPADAETIVKGCCGLPRDHAAGSCARVAWRGNEVVKAAVPTAFSSVATMTVNATISIWRCIVGPFFCLPASDRHVGETEAPRRTGAMVIL